MFWVGDEKNLTSSRRFEPCWFKKKIFAGQILVFSMDNGNTSQYHIIFNLSPSVRCTFSNILRARQPLSGAVGAKFD